MTRKIEALSQLGLLSQLVGTLTDSRSYLSCLRREDLRRLLCNILRRDMRRGLLPDDETFVAPMVSGICHKDAR